MSKRLLYTIVLIVLAIVWGSSFILMKRGLEVFSPVQVASLRLALAGLTLLPLSIRFLPREPRKSFFPLLIVGWIGNGVPAFLFTFSQTKLSSSLAGALNALTPLFTLILGVLVFKTAITKNKTLGVLLGLAGALLLIFLRAEGGFDPNFAYAFLVVLATLFYAISVNVIKSKLQDSKALSIASIQLLFAGIPGAIALFSTDFTSKMESTPGAWTALGYVTVLAIVGTALAIILFNWLVQQTNAVFASSVTYLIPVVAVFWGILDGEPFGWYLGLGLCAILAGIYLINKR